MWYPSTVLGAPKEKRFFETRFKIRWSEYGDLCHGRASPAKFTTPNFACDVNPKKKLIQRGVRRTRMAGAGGCKQLCRSGVQHRLQARHIQTKSSHFAAVIWNARQRLDRFHAGSRALVLHYLRHEFENNGVCFWPLPLVS